MEDPRGWAHDVAVDLVPAGGRQDGPTESTRDVPGPVDELSPGAVDVVVDLVPRAGREAALRQTVQRNARAIEARTPGCLAMVLREGPGGRQTVIQRWVDERALDDFAASSGNAEYVESLIGLLAEPMAVRLLRPRRDVTAQARPAAASAS